MSTRLKAATLAIALAIIAPCTTFAQTLPDVCAKVEQTDSRIDSRSSSAEERARKSILALERKLNRLVTRNEAKKDQSHGRAGADNCPAKVAYQPTLFSAGQCNIQ
jgi:hypothetical protein